ncbi:MAG: hypothetical protein HRU80_02960 [Ignavibacteriales bacterium]|nr:hypothetical protein [Ignavibacteriaceae bacterium]MCK6614287.1 hypothetical protein [Ignavibacteriaceae bacterium]QOJ27884.1 MAG: hypothetical protein HRU80_02960 [Ignavibacteriales bacterium]
MQYDWLREVDIKHLTGDMREVAEITGMEKFILLFHAFNKSELYFSENQLENAAAAYVKRHPDTDHKVLARKLGISVRKVKKLLNGER